MIKIIRTLNLNREITAVLQNAYDIGYEKQTNAIWSASFSLPLNDPKVGKVELLQYVEITDGDEYIGLFRIIPKLTIKSESTQEVCFQCEHVLSTLLDSTLFQYHQLSNYTTKVVLQYLLDVQKTKHWKLGKVDFTRYFHYGWENDNLLSALFSVPKSFNEQYRWTWDTRTYPWTLNLVHPETEPTCRIKEGYNLQSIEIEENPMSVFNRIYPLGAGEGVNQLTIESVNNGVPFLEDRKPGEEVKETVWADLRFTDAASLKASGQALLDKWKNPIVTWRATAADVSSITGLSIDELKEGRVVRLQLKDYPITDLRIMKETKPDIIGDPGNVQLDIGNVQEDLSTTQTDLERRQKVNETYSQGATNIDSRDFIGECDANFPAIMRFYIPDDVVNINEMTLTFETQKYRAYSKAIEGGGAVVSSTDSGGALVKATSSGGAIVKSTTSGGSIVRSTTSGGGTTATSSSGGGTTATSTSGGGIAKSTASGGGSTQTSNSGGATTRSSSAGGDHTHRLFVGSSIVMPTIGNQHFRFRLAGGGSVGVAIPIERLTTENVVTDTSSGDHSHSVAIPAHTHNVSIPSHTHNFEIPNHAHNVTIQNHTHSVTIPNHSHEVHLPAHAHEVHLPAHTHDIHIPSHKHDITLPDHVHAIKHGIFEYDKLPSKVEITVDGNVLPITAISGQRIDLIPFLQKDTSGKINRGRYAEIKIKPNDLARINATVSSRLFIQSRIGTVA